MTGLSKRQQIVDVALVLFYENGFHATGVEKIREVANVSKKTLYNHFRSKDELILAALRQRDEQFRNDFMRGVERHAKTPRERLEAVFDVLGEWFNSKGYLGCMFINASAEFSAQDDPSHKICAEHKRLVLDYIKKLAIEAKAKDPETLAEQLNLLAEGAIVQAHICDDKEAATKAKSIAKILIDQALYKIV